ncbi:DUF4185 domain-containing protein [Erythrobacter sp. GH3-10]|uniref:DUF4185 domain-containing protein n=2 Tax=Aurantiacibacter rhizosphaerae TaxID=2691582 RepID=A0A844XAA3_9SPHN|nr:DUF4185 domain-containing protein [Aurantiacibacter rhizosphaerae]
MTVTADGNQLIVVNDGAGWAPPPATFYSTRLWTIEGGPQGAEMAQLEGYPVFDRAALPENAPSYYGHGVLAVGNHLYQFLATLDDAEDRPRHWTGAKLIHSPDGGATWLNRDGSSPVIWEGWDEQAGAGFPFLNEENGAFSLLSFLQQGPAYSQNRDGYIYVYGLNGSVDGLMNQLVMFRVKKDSMLSRDAYRFFAGRDEDGTARWSCDIADRQPVHTFPRGWVNYTNLFPGDLVVESWLPSVVWNEALGIYMMTSAGIGNAEDGTEFGKPSYLGVWVSENPWGPWRQVHEDTAWTPDGDAGARAYAPQIAPGWIAPDGKSFWMVWADLAGLRAFGRDGDLVDAEMAKAKDATERTMIEAAILRRYMPNFAMNAQRIDLVLD